MIRCINFKALLFLGFLIVSAEGKSDPELIIRDIFIDNRNIFDVDTDLESGFLYRLANTLHIKSKKRTIRKYLLFSPGDSFDINVIHETERLLREKRFLHDASIVHVIHGTEVDIYVTTKDTWSLKPKVSAGHSGGETRSELGVTDDNLLGLGIRASFGIKNNSQRRSTILKLVDDNAFDRFYHAEITAISSTDGSEHGLSLYKPFYAFNTRHSYGVKIWQQEQMNSYFIQDVKELDYRSKIEKNDIWWGVAIDFGMEGKLRTSFGLAEEYRSYVAEISPSDDYESASRFNLQLLYPYIDFSYTENKYLKTKNAYKVGITEDVYQGLMSGIRIGYLNNGVSNSSADWVVESNIHYSTSIFNSLATIQAEFSGRLGSEGVEDGRLGISATHLIPQSDKLKLYTTYNLEKLIRPYAFSQLYIDSTSGFRGYPLYTDSGTMIEKLSIEQRYYSNWYIARVFHIGFAAFYDTGNIYDADGANRHYRSAGVGIRMLNSRTSRGGVLHLDISKPMDLDGENGWRFRIETERYF